METNLIVAGTDTNVGKTVFSAMLMQAMAAAGRDVHYWKPVQSGLEGGVDTRTVQRLSGLTDSYFLPEAYVLSEPLSPHRAAELDGVAIDVEALALPPVEGRLVIEGAGGLMVPLSRSNLQVNQFKRWNGRVILCARTGLGTINHTLLSLEALWARDIPLLGIVFIGGENKDNIKTIAEFSGERVLGHLPWMDEPTPEALAAAFAQHFDLSDFA